MQNSLSSEEQTTTISVGIPLAGVTLQAEHVVYGAGDVIVSVTATAGDKYVGTIAIHCMLDILSFVNKPRFQNYIIDYCLY